MWGDYQTVAKSWLVQQCAMISGVNAGIVLLGKPGEGPYLPATCWPLESDCSETLRGAADRVCEEKCQQSYSDDEPSGSADLVAYPLLLDGLLCGAVALHITHREKAKREAALRALMWGANWLLTMIEQQRQGDSNSEPQLLELLAALLSEETLPVRLGGMVNTLARQLDCDRVSLAVNREHELEFLAISPAVEINRETQLLRSLKEVLFEAMDQDSTLHYPPLEGNPVRVFRANRKLVELSGNSVVITLPIAHRHRFIAGVILERSGDHPLNEQEWEYCQMIASLLGPILDSQLKVERSLAKTVAEAVANAWSKFLGAQGLWMKTTLLALLLLVGFLYFWQGEYRVDARAILEGTVQRLVSAPFDGYLKSARTRAGDLVVQGDVLCQLDDRELKLERAKWRSELTKLEREQRKALAGHERSNVRILTAKSEQAMAELSLVEQKLKAAQVASPIDGVIVSGDLSRSLGVPLERGQALFKIAPLNAYRVMLEVEEGSISEITKGQSGQIVLAGLPNQHLLFQVKRILPIAKAEEGKNFFFVEAELEQNSDLLRPGMQGVGKITVGERRLIWLLTHRLVDWLKIKAWVWFGWL